MSNDCRLRGFFHGDRTGRHAGLELVEGVPEFFGSGDALDAQPILAQLEASDVRDFLATEPAFELVTTGILLLVDAAGVIPTNSLLVQPLHGAPLEQVGAAAVQAGVARRGEQVNARVAERGDDQRILRLAGRRADED